MESANVKFIYNVRRSQALTNFERVCGGGVVTIISRLLHIIMHVADVA